VIEADSSLECFNQATPNQAEKNPGLFEKIWKYILNNVTVIVFLYFYSHLQVYKIARTDLSHP
jgi:hypothetical protein